MRRKPSRGLAYQITIAEARERERMANLLHDELGQLLAVAQVRLGELGATLSGAARRHVSELRALLEQASRTTRVTVSDLHSPLLQQLGLRPAIAALVDRMNGLGQAEFREEGELGRLSLDPLVQSVLMRAVRELLFNAYKHARARRVLVRLAHDARRLSIQVTDDGSGFDTRELGRSVAQGYGLASMKAQLLGIGGALDLHSTPGAGTRATITLSLARAAAGAPVTRAGRTTSRLSRLRA